MRQIRILLLVIVNVAFFVDVSEGRPNIVMIIGDDQGYGDYGFMGHPEIETPNLDRLAKNSLVFRRGYVVAPLCRPSLASIVTGLYPHQHGVCANDVDPSNRAESDAPLQKQFHEHPSLVRMLVNNGYVAFQSGKWWEGSWKDGGFTSGMTHGDPQRGGRHGDVGLKIGRNGVQPIRDFIDKAVDAEQPFFVWYAPFMPHTPHDPPPEPLAKYAKEGRPENVAKYYAMCDWFDDSCGQLLRHLQNRDLLESTIVVYISDNGYAPVDHAADNPADWWPDYAPRTKGSPFELGIRTPILISIPRVCWRGKGPRKYDSNELASSIDLMPTILSASGIDIPEGLPGIDLVEQARLSVYGGAWSIHNMKVGDTLSTLQYRYCITRRWKLLLRHDGSDTTRYRTVHEWDGVKQRLYRVDSDPDEEFNIGASHPERVDILTRRLNKVIPAADVVAK